MTPAATRRRIPPIHPCAREARESCIPNIGGAPSGERGWRSRPCESCIASPRERPSRWRVPPAPLWSPPRALPVYDSGVPLSSEDNKDRPFIPDWGCDADMPFTVAATALRFFQSPPNALHLSAKNALLCFRKDAHFTPLCLYFLTRYRKVPVPSQQRSARENVITFPSSSPIQEV